MHSYINPYILGMALSEYQKEESTSLEKISSLFKQSKLQYQDLDKDEPKNKNNEVLRDIYEIKHVQNLIVSQNNHKTLKRHIQNAILNLKKLNNLENKDSETFLHVCFVFYFSLCFRY